MSQRSPANRSRVITYHSPILAAMPKAVSPSNLGRGIAHLRPTGILNLVVFLWARAPAMSPMHVYLYVAAVR